MTMKSDCFRVKPEGLADWLAEFESRPLLLLAVGLSSPSFSFLLCKIGIITGLLWASVRECM
jgi:hypothetical protein